MVLEKTRGTWGYAGLGQSWARARDQEWVPPPHLFWRWGSSLAPPPTDWHSGNFHQDTPSPLPSTARPRARFYRLNLTWTFKNSYLYGNQLILKEIEYFSSLWCENKMCRVGSPAKKVSLDCKEIKPVHPKGNQS